MVKKSELAYTLEDYQVAGVEAPERIIAHPTACEGELMTDAEVDSYCADSLGVIRILGDRNPSRAVEIRRTFLTDCEFLLKIGRITEDEIDNLLIEAGVREP